MKSETHSLIHEVWHEAEIEPKLQPLQGESFHNNSTAIEDEARLDIKANRLWGSRFSRAFFDVNITKRCRSPNISKEF